MTRRSSEEIARETLDAIRLAIEASADDRAAVMVIRTLLADSTPARPDDTGSVRRLLRAVKRTRRARWSLT
jgi:hypothetical protein